MGNTIILDTGALAIKEETTEGTYVAETATTSFLEVLADGFEIVPSREVIERDIRTATVESDAPRVGTKSVTASIPTELKAGASAGAAPRADLLLQALLGGKRNSAAITCESSNTDTVLEIPSTDGTARVDTLTCVAKASCVAGDFIIIRAQDGTVYGAAVDLTGSAAEPTSPKWLAIPATNKVQVDVSSTTDAASVAAAFELAMDAISGFTAKIVTDDTAGNGTMTFTQASQGIIADSYGKALTGTEDYSAASVTDESSAFSWDDTTAGVDSSINKLRVGDVIMVKESGAYHISPIASKDADSITLLVAHPDGAMSNSVVIEAFTTYYHDTENAPTLSLTNYIGDTIREKALGCRVTGMELAGFSTGATLAATYALEGLSFAREVGSVLYTPAYDSILPPIVLNAKILKDGTEITANELTLSISNTLGFKTSTSSANGKVASRITKQAITGTVNPYMEDDDVDVYTLFEAGTSFSLYAHAQIDTSTDGQYQNMVGIYMPNCKVPELGTGNQEGLATDVINFTAHRTSGHDSIYITFS